MNPFLLQMKQINHSWSGWASFLLVTVLFSNTSGCIYKMNRITAVYGRVTDQAGQPVDSVTILFAGTIGVSAGFPIKETLTDSNGSYEIVVNVPRKYHSAGIVSSLDFESLRSKYSSQNRLIYKNGVQKGSCCFVTMGEKTRYDFVLLPK